MIPRDMTPSLLCLALLSVTPAVMRSAALEASQVVGKVSLKTDDYYSYEGMVEYMEQLTATYSHRLTMHDVGTTYENRTLKTITVTNGDGRMGKQVIFLVATAHAREWLTPVGALYTLEQLVVNYEANAHLLKDFDWIIMPMVNPDGYMYSRTTDREWRNNRSPNGGHCFGTNLNRNFDIGWRTGYKEQLDPCTSHYAGSKAFSEPEARAVRDVMQDLVDTHRAVMYLTLHSRRRTVYYPWVYKNTPTDNDRQLKEIARIGAEAMHRVAGTTYSYGQPGLEDAFGGTSMDYAYSIGFPLSFALELTGQRGDNVFDFWPPTSLLRDLGEETWLGIRAMAEKTMEYYPYPIHKSIETSSESSLKNIFKIILLLLIISIFSS